MKWKAPRLAFSDRKSQGRGALEIGKHPAYRIKRRENRRVLPSAIRWGLYGLVTAGFFQGFVFASYFVDAKRLFAENGPVEWCQFLLLLACCGCLQAIAARTGSQREIARIGIFFILMAAVREMDANLDRYVFDGA